MNSAVYQFNRDHLLSISLTPISCESDFSEVRNLRFDGYKGVFRSPDEASDEIDTCPNATVLLARDSHESPIGTVRVVDSSAGSIELDSLNPSYKDAINNKSIVEGSRLVAVKNSYVPQRTIQVALWKAVLDFATFKKAEKIIVWAKRGPDKGYKFLQFDHLENCGFEHPTLANAHYEVYALDIRKAEVLAKRTNHPLYDFFFTETYDNLIWYQ